MRKGNLSLSVSGSQGDLASGIMVATQSMSYHMRHLNCMKEYECWVEGNDLGRYTPRFLC